MTERRRREAGRADQVVRKVALLGKPDASCDLSDREFSLTQQALSGIKPALNDEPMQGFARRLFEEAREMELADADRRGNLGIIEARGKVVAHVLTDPA